VAPPRFITFEGGEGSGKSTQARLLLERLRAEGIDALMTREPGGSAFAEQIRALLLDAASAAHGVMAETLLFYAARADHLDKLIRPALAEGRWVVCDRFSDSTLVYQSMAGGLAREVVDALEKMIVAPTTPDLTLVLDVPPETGLKRAVERRQITGAPDAFETRDLAYHRRLREGFTALTRSEPRRCLLIDGTRGREVIAAEIWSHVGTLRGTC
jgi:dTMP kinase